jgi:protein-arginine deiminase
MRGCLLWLSACALAGAQGGGGPPAVEIGFGGAPRTLVLAPNLDDDDGDGVADGEDERTNGDADLADTGVVKFRAALGAEKPAVRLAGPGADAFRLLDIAADGQDLLVRVEAKRPREGDAPAYVTYGAESRPLAVAPLVVRSPLAPAREVFVVKVPRSAAFVEELRGVLAGTPTKLTVLEVPEGSRSDVWAQDATEILAAAVPSPTAYALHGLRAKSDAVRGEPLDRHFAAQFRGADRASLRVGTPRPDRRWIDWFGNLEASPPYAPKVGATRPHGRLLIGRQDALTMDEDVLQFLERQGAQWPPLYVDTSWLLIGHVDEAVNFVPGRDGAPRVVLPSPDAAWALLARWKAEGLGGAVVLEGKAREARTVDSLLADAGLKKKNAAVSEALAKLRADLAAEFGWQFVELPQLFTEQGLTVWPNMVNGFVVGDRYLAPRPFGPRKDGADLLETAARAAFAAAGAAVDVRFLDAYDAYSRMAGEVHCGTNAVR